MVRSLVKFVGLATLTVLLTTQFAAAGPGANGKGAGALGKGAEMRAELLKRFDKDGDGKLNEEERAAAKQAMQVRGGRPGPKGQEKLGAGKGQPGQGAPGNRPNKEEFLKRFDKNGDGKITDDERAAAKQAMQERRAKKNEK